MVNETTTSTEAAAVIAVTKEAEAGVLRPLDPAKARLLSVTVPNGYTRETVDLSRYLPAPARMTGTVAMQTVDDFARYAQRHDDAGATTIWVDAAGRTLTAVLDDHAVDSDIQGGPGWGEHRAKLQLRHTDEWTHWVKGDGEWMNQEAFAEHIEDGQVEIQTPDAGELLDIVTTMQGHTDVQWKQAVRLATGAVQFTYNEEGTATAGGTGDLEIPTMFDLWISPFVGEEPVKLQARLRYRVRAGELKIGYKLVRPGDALRDATDHIADRLAKTFGEHRTFVGTPRST